MAAGCVPEGAAFDWRDPLLIEDLLTEEEPVLIRDDEQRLRAGEAGAAHPATGRPQLTFDS